MSFIKPEPGQRENWKNAKTDLFWSEVAVTEHVLQIYETEEVFLDTLIAFVGSAINTGDCAVVLATEAHLNALNHGLGLHGIKVPDLIVEGRYIPLVASVALSKFMVNGMPDERLFFKMVNMLLLRGVREGYKVRAFGELVALLWADGNKAAAVALEKMWCNIWRENNFSLLCAYPAAGFIDVNPDESLAISEICRCHTKLIAGNERQTHEFNYKDISEYKGPISEVHPAASEPSFIDGASKA